MDLYSTILTDTSSPERHYECWLYKNMTGLAISVMLIKSNQDPLIGGFDLHRKKNVHKRPM